VVVTTVEETIVSVVVELLVVVELVVLVVELEVVVELELEVLLVVSELEVLLVVSELEVLLVVSELEAVDRLVLVVVSVPLKVKSCETGKPRWLLSNEVVWLAVNLLFSLKLIESPVLQIWSDCPHASSSYCPLLVKVEPTI
jgi:hypothetical protein